VSGWQRDTEVATILWPGMPTWAGGPKPPAVMWRHGTNFGYLPPELARQFARALQRAADQIEREEGGS
jgi:hypothetical protein